MKQSATRLKSGIPVFTTLRSIHVLTATEITQDLKATLRTCSQTNPETARWRLQERKPEVYMSPKRHCNGTFSFLFSQSGLDNEDLAGPSWWWNCRLLLRPDSWGLLLLRIKWGTSHWSTTSSLPPAVSIAIVIYNKWYQYTISRPNSVYLRCLIKLHLFLKISTMSHV